MGDREISEIVIDFEKIRNEQLNESIFNFMKFWVGKALRVLLGDIDFAIPVKIKGTPAEVRSFVSALGNQKSYVEAYRSYGLDDPKTYRSKSKLRAAAGNFERKTGLKWPFDA